ncbi:MAG: protein-L-isoaspartate(D-aspartate) O-methyltransferase [Candidatus Omnitrophica bacterium]|nr:protein-L-isoaspartate(D-aspartate) O-methyltransferase [Candidatus Omnitrophota bacterium]
MAFEPLRARMVDEQLRRRGLTDPRLLAAFRKVPRHLFVPEELREEAYADHPLPIGGGQTISQPYIAALMTSQLNLQGHERVLEVGTGSGYQAAILAELALEVFSVERIPDLLLTAQERLTALGYLNVHLATSNGSLGWPEHAPYDAILVTAAAPNVPQPLLDQLADRGRMVIPIGPPAHQMLHRIHKQDQRLRREAIASCVFVPLVGAHGWPPEGV